MPKLFLKQSGIAVLIILLNLNPLINILSAEHINFGGQDEKEVASSLIDIAATSIQIKNSIKNPIIIIQPGQKSLNKICALSNSICYKIEMYLNFNLLHTKFPRWSKSTFT